MGVWIATKPIELDKQLTVVQIGQARYQQTLPNLITLTNMCHKSTTTRTPN
jgi:hypothetical protein